MFQSQQVLDLQRISISEQADIANAVLKILEIKNLNPHQDIPQPDPHDIPGDWFKGPF